MHISSHNAAHTDVIADLFEATFTASEGAAEGQIVGTLARNLLTTTRSADLFSFSAWNGDTITGCILFSRLTFEDDNRTVFLLSPIAVHPDVQRQGIGQQLITHGLNILRDHGVEAAMTYGDPAYYAQVGFQPISTSDAAPPFPLSQPEGWLAQSLTNDRLTPFKGPSHCVNALNDPDYW